VTAEIPLFFAAAMAVLAGAVTAILIARKGIRDRKALPGRITRKRERELDAIDGYLRRLDQAATRDEIDSLEQERDKE